VADFVFATCLPGVEPAVKREVARTRPELRFAYSRPGLVTFKSPTPVTPEVPSGSVFARVWGRSIGAARSPEDAAAQLAPFGVNRVHVFVREDAPVENLFDRAAKSSSFRAIKASDVVSTAENATRSRMTMKDVSAEAWRATIDLDAWQAIGPGGPAQRGELVADIIIAPANATGDPMIDDPGIPRGLLPPSASEASEFKESPEIAAWLGLHRHDATRSPDPGGATPAEMPPESPSRAYCKLEEAIAWLDLPLVAGQRALEIGAAPGGAVLALARRGLHVIAVDTGDLAAQVLAFPNVKHEAKKVGALRWEDLPDPIDWLLVDMNLAPQVAVHEVARLMPHLISHLRGAILTLKMNDWAFVDELPRLAARIAELGLPNIRMRHLPSNRREICCVALRS